MHTEPFKLPVFPTELISRGRGQSHNQKWSTCTITTTFYALKINNNDERTCTVLSKKRLNQKTCSLFGFFCTFAIKF